MLSGQFVMQSFDQERLLNEAIASAKQCAALMEPCLDDGNLMEAIHYATDMLREMKTSLLSPKSYYELYIVVTEKLRILECYLIEEHRSGRKIPDLYETVQYIASIIPRLYLLVTVGVYHIKCSELSRREIMRDLVEMCCGVQHPIRGLFLRSYLLQSLRTELLPVKKDTIHVMTQPGAGSAISSESTPSTFEQPPIVPADTEEQGTITDTVNFLLLNFAEMNKLWIRMQHQGHSRDRERREQERRELRLLVGTNLNRLAELDMIDAARFQKQVLPPILEQLIECRDVIAQEYLMDVIIQVFPDEFHLATLPLLLGACDHLRPSVRTRQIVCGLLDRLTRYVLKETAAGRSFPAFYFPTDFLNTAQSNRSTDDEPNGRRTVVTTIPSKATSESNLFILLFNGLARLLESKIIFTEKMDPAATAVTNSSLSSKCGQIAFSSALAASGLPPEDIPAMYAALICLAMVLHPEQSPPLVDACLNAVADLLSHIGLNQIPSISPLSRELLHLLRLPLGGVSAHLSSDLSQSTNTSGTGAPLGVLCELRSVLSMPGFSRLVSLLDPKTAKCRLACSLLAGALDCEQRQRQLRRTSVANGTMCLVNNACRLMTEADVAGLFGLISDLLSPDAAYIEDAEEFSEVQSLIAGILHLVGPESPSENPELCYRLLCKVQSYLSDSSVAVIRFNFPSLVFEGLRLIEAYADIEPRMPTWDGDVQNVVVLVHQCIAKLVTVEAPESALRLFLEAALVIDRIPFSNREAMAYEFISQALTLYEEGISESRAQIDAITLIMSTLCRMRGFSVENRSTLRNQCTRATLLLLRKHDQSRAMAAAAHQFWPVPVLSRHNCKPCILVDLTNKTESACPIERFTDCIAEKELETLRDAKAAVACLDRAMKLAKSCMDATVKAQLFLNILNHAICLRMANCSEITDDRIRELTEAINNLIIEIKPSGAVEELQRHLSDTLRFLETSDTRDPAD